MRINNEIFRYKKKFNSLEIEDKIIFLEQLMLNLTTEIRLLTKISEDSEKSLRYCRSMNELIRHFIYQMMILRRYVNDNEPEIKPYVSVALKTTISLLKIDL